MQKPQTSMALFAGVVAAFATCSAFAQEARQAPKTVPAQAAAQMPTQARDAAATGMAHAGHAKADPVGEATTAMSAADGAKADAAPATPAKADAAMKQEPR